ncbi:hypothetical protein RCL1_002438 [Eukaryota sp. TZLM3-RCL]
MLSLVSYSANYGFLDAICRGYIASLLTARDYSALADCTSIGDIRIHLSHFDYTELKSERASIDFRRFREILINSFVKQFNYLKSQSSSLLRKFLDYCTYGYMIDNIVLIIKGSVKGLPLQDLLSQCHPLGMFHNIGVLAAATTPEEVYNFVLVDTPLKTYFNQSVSIADLNDLHIEIIRNTLYKCYLEDFHNLLKTEFSKLVDNSLIDLIEFEADRRKVVIALNSLNTDLTRDVRASMFPTVGKLSPEIFKQLSQANSTADVENAVSGSYFGPLFRIYKTSKDLSLDDLFYRHAIQLSKIACISSHSFGAFYSWILMKEQEIRNLIWIFDCVDHGQYSKISRYVSIY